MAKQPFSGRRPSGRRPYGQSNQLRKNERIRMPEVRVIGADGKQIGVIPTSEALRLAKREGLDLVEVSPTTRPPVCRILDFGKYMYEQSKKTKEAKTTTTKLKEVKFRVNIDEHDYMTKLRRGETFLNKGNKLKITLMFRGRQMEHKNLGFDVVNRAIKDLEEMGQADADPRLAGRNITVTLSPLAANKRKLRHSIDHDVDEEADDE